MHFFTYVNKRFISNFHRSVDKEMILSVTDDDTDNR